MAHDTLDSPAAEVPPSGDRSRTAEIWLRAVAATASGALLTLSYPPFGWWPLAPVGAMSIVLAVRGVGVRLGLLLGFLAGLGLFLPLLEWARVVGADGWIALSVFEALYIALLGGALAVVTRLPAWPLWTAALWVAEELLRGRFPLGGFTWGRLAFSQASSPFTPYAAVGGAPLVTFATALTGGLLAWAVVTARRRRVVAAASLVGAVAVPAAAYAVPIPTAGEPVTAAAVQGNVPRSGLDFLGRPWQVLNNHVDQTHRLAQEVRAGRVQQPDFVIWPENASDIDPYADPEARRVIQDAVSEVGAPVLVGALRLHRQQGTRENLGIAWDPATGPGVQYVKRHPVPFGEYVPFRNLLTPLAGRFDMVPLDMIKGDRVGAMDLGPVRIGDVICFEVAYDRLVRDVVDHGAQILVVQTNNATFGHSAQPQQQLAISRLRAVEHGRAVVIAATSGISAVVAPDGRLLDVSDEFTADLLVEQIPARTAQTWADRLGGAPEWALTFLGLGAVAFAAVRSRKGT